MGERKGQNHYYPPDFDPAQHGSLNGYHGVHALRERANKISQGILVIRFEAPWNFWCGGCGSHVGRGVRFNAEKSRVGSYYTTPIYAFKMKCHRCDNHFTFETDPKNCDYTITVGARRKNEQWDPEADDSIAVPDREEKALRERDAMYRLEQDAGDQARAARRKPAIVRLLQLKDATTADDYGSNAALRAAFRVQRKEHQRQRAEDDALRKRTSLDVELLPETAEDVALARQVRFEAEEKKKKNGVAPTSLRARRRSVREASIFGSLGSAAGSVKTAAGRGGREGGGEVGEGRRRGRAGGAGTVPQKSTTAVEALAALKAASGNGKRAAAVAALAHVRAHARRSGKVVSAQKTATARNATVAGVTPAMGTPRKSALASALVQPRTVAARGLVDYDGSDDSS